MIRKLADIKNVFYINLDDRKDRRNMVEKELKKIGIENATRFSAIKMENGALGCSLSHLKCIQMAKENEWDHVLIVEDDIEFLDPSAFVSKSDAFFSRQNEWHVLLFAGNNMLPYTQVDDLCIQVHTCLTTTGYLVRSHYFDTLIHNYREGIRGLMREPENKKKYAIDKNWISLQMRDKWFLLIPPTVTQREDYSDIEKKKTNFVKYMLNYNKCYK
jgi:glycosyl transferase family 25